MMRIDAAGRPGPVRAGHRDQPVAGAATDRGRALTVVPVARQDEDGGARSRWRPGTTGRPEAGFVVQLIVAADPALRPARVERARAAAALYAQAAERFG